MLNFCVSPVALLEKRETWLQEAEFSPYQCCIENSAKGRQTRGKKVLSHWGNRQVMFGTVHVEILSSVAADNK